MKFIPILLSLITTNALATNMRLNCQLKHNDQIKLESQISLKAMEKNQSVGIYEQFELFVSSMGGQKIEIQLLDISEPSRSYASGVMTADNSRLEIVIWKRDYLIEANCSL